MTAHHGVDAEGGAPAGLLHRLQAGLTRLEDVAAAIACVCLFAIMAIVSSDVAMRYLAGKPFTWSYDLVSIYLTVALFFLALSPTLREDGHIRVDLLHQHMGPRLLRACELVGTSTSAAFFVLLALLSGQEALSQYRGGEVISSAYDWPTWMATAVVFAGATLMSLRLLLASIGHAASLATGRDCWPLPEAHGEEAALAASE